MSVRKDLSTGKLTFDVLSKLIRHNENKEQELGVRLSWRFVGPDIRSRVFGENNKILHERIYSSDYVHVRYALMHLDWSEFLGVLEENIKIQAQALRKKQMIEQEEGWPPMSFYRKNGGKS